MENAIDIAPVEEALTFARHEIGGGHRLILVSKYENGAVTGVDLTATLGAEIDDPIAAYAAYGYDGLAAHAASRETVTVPLLQLTLPVALTASHIATGTNFPEHGKEASITDGPFLFPKEVEPTAFNAPVSSDGALLDHEVELCFVALEDIDLGHAPERTGLLLCNDFTDRAKLMRHIDPKDVTSGKGFTTGKSAPGFMPVGNLFLIPNDLRDFAAKVELRLYRNGELRQAARQSEAIWDFDELLRRTWARQHILWDHLGRKVGLAIERDRIPARTAFLGGTPDGTIFRGVNKSAILLGLWDWAAGGWSRPATHWIVERHIAGELRGKRYLQPGERIRIAVRHLGELDNLIVE
jgi:2-keto-4-pentenoate hydratase/2-oxohepta-3-ene-1,7-dioic acid hydratase in catechol pathway